MARSRNIKPGLPANDDIAACSPLARLLAAYIPMFADRNGVLQDKPLKVKAQILPYDNCDIVALLDELLAVGYIARFEAAGEKYLHVVNFKKHQRPHKNELALYPEPVASTSPDLIEQKNEPIEQEPDPVGNNSDASDMNDERGMLIDEQGMRPSGAGSVFTDSELEAVIPETFRTPEVLEAVHDWKKTRSDQDGNPIGLTPIELKNILYGVADKAPGDLLVMLRASVAGRWKGLHEHRNFGGQSKQKSNLSAEDLYGPAANGGAD